MEKLDDIVDPLEQAFADPKAGKKLKPGETLPGLEGSTHSSFSADELAPEAEMALSNALDDAFSNPDFGGDSPASRPQSVPLEDADVIEARLARSLDDAFANPKVGEKINEASGTDGVSLGAGLEGDLHMDDHMPGKPKAAGIFGPKFLVIAMGIMALVLVAVSMGAEPETGPTILRLND